MINDKEDPLKELQEKLEEKHQHRKEVQANIRKNIESNIQKNIQHLDLNKKKTIRKQFAKITAIYVFTAVAISLGLNTYYTVPGTFALISQGLQQQASYVGSSISPYFTAENQNTEAIQNHLVELSKTAPDFRYAVIQDSKGGQVTGWFADQNSKINFKPIEGNYLRENGLIITRQAFIGADNNTYHLQYASVLMPFLDCIMSSYIRGLFVITGLLILAGAIVWNRYKHTLVIPLEKLSTSAVKILKSGDLRVQIPLPADNELGQLTKIINANNAKQRALLTDIKACCDNFINVNENLSKAGTVLNSNAVEIHQQASDGSKMMNDLLSSFNQVSSQLQDLNGQVERGSTTVYQMEQVNREVTENISAMGGAVNDSITAISQMSSSIQQNAEHIEQLNNAISIVGNSMQRLDDSIASEERNAKETMAVAQQLLQDAEVGMATIEETLAGIAKIQESSNKVSDTITHLGKQANSIGKILKVIEDVTNQTNLLALNAAIIAAQAGEQGRGFAVVADEIGGLASRTKNSTKEISDLIANIQAAIQQAIVAMQDDQMSISNGSRLGQQAASSFAALKESANISANQSQVMADATIEQASEVRSVNAAIRDIIQAIGRINSSSHNQSDEANSMNNAANKMNHLNQQVAGSSSEQARSSREVLDVISNINNMTGHVNKAQQEQTNNTVKAATAVDVITHKADEQQIAAHNLELIIDNINVQINQLSGYLGECKF